MDRELVHEALECLYDNVDLNEARLCQQLVPLEQVQDHSTRAETLRSLLLEAIEALYPKRHVPFGSLDSRAYDVLTLRYVENMPIAGIERELHVGKRQVFRDLEQAETRLGEVLTAWTRADRSVDAGASPQRDTLSDELLTLSSEPGRVSLRGVLDQAFSLVAPLAQQSRVTLNPPPSSDDCYVLADRALLRQVLVQFLSFAIQATTGSVDVLIPGQVETPPDAPGERTGLVIRFRGAIDAPTAVRPRHGAGEAGRDDAAPDWGAAGHDRRLLAPLRVATALGVHCALATSAPGVAEIRLGIRSGAPVSVLVVEDNPGAVELYRRYLGPRGWQLHSVSDPRLAYEVARKMRPDVIILDIMMPKLDGWTVLQTIRQQADTSAIPVLVCSVMEDPGLAQALGATDYLNKPVSQGEFLAALRHSVSGRGAEASPAAAGVSPGSG